MAGNANHQVWLTSVVNDEDVARALTLCFSLKRVLSTRKVGVLISSNVDYACRKSLHHGFDYLFKLEEVMNTAKLKDAQFAKLFTLTLKCFEKIIYLSPATLVIRNPDDLFEQVLKPGTIKCLETEEMFIFAVHPSLQAFESIMEGLCSKNETTFEGYIRTWNINQSKLEASTEKSGRVVSLNSPSVFRYYSDTSMVILPALSMDEIMENFGLLGKMVADKWKMIYHDNVKPLLNSASNADSSTSKITHLSSSPCFDNESIAIIGMSCRYPSANNLEEFWNLLLNGQDGTGTPPDCRWLRHHSSRNSADYRNTNAGFLKFPVEDFDSKFFGISPKEMVFLDPQHRLLHEIVWEALEDAAINPQSLEGSNGGVFIGSWLNEYKEILSLSGKDEFYRMYMGTGIGAGGARISHLLGLTGPCVATESGCSSAMVAVHLACKSLQRGETNLALACGVNLLLHPFDKDIMPMVVSPDGHSKTFDANADGYGRAEGCGVLVLKRHSQAVKDGDNIWALIKGSAMTQEGVSKSMGTPTIHCESLAMTQALRDARVNPESVSYVEAHGTGTTVGDPLEVAAIAKAYNTKARTEPLYIGSVKTNVGHTESCSGITGIMKVVLAMQHETIPPHINFKTLNPSINLDAVPATIPIQPVNWGKKLGHPRFAGVSSFGVTGTDAHVILEEPPSHSETALICNDNIERPLHIMKISAKTDEALNILIENYKNHLSTSVDDFKQLSYTSNVGRADFSQRAILVAKSEADAIKKIQNNQILRGEESKLGNDKICFLFTGQGSQYPGMAKQLYETSPLFRIHFEYCAELLIKRYDIDIAQVLWGTEKSSEVSRTIFSQTSIFCVEYALLKLWESWGIKPDCVLGHSLGEYAAAVCAEILSVEDALKLVAERSQLIDQLPCGKMLVIKADKQRVDVLMREFAKEDSNSVLDYAAINSSDQTVVAGDSDLVLNFSELCKERSIKCIVLEATHAFHSKHMDPMLDEYRTVAKTATHLKSNGPTFISGMRGGVVEDINEIHAEYWVEHTREKVLFLNASKKAVELGCKIFIELGPQPVLSALTQMNNDANIMCLPSLKRNENEWETLLNTLGKLYVTGMQINWKGFDQFYARQKVRLPHYPFIGKAYWPDVVASNGVCIHPLLGSVIPNASSVKLFESSLNLNGLEYMKDHCIGNKVIFPGAGYLEICLAAGLASTECSSDTLSQPTRAMKVENLTIEAPLQLTESTAPHIQTVAELNKDGEGGWSDISIKIFRRVTSETSKWHPHATATFSAVPTQEDKEISFDLNAFLQTLEKVPEDEAVLLKIYEKLASVGLKFGPTFKSIEKVWRDNAKETLVAKVNMSSLELARCKYIIHPVILDAMIQAIMMLRPISNLKKSLYVPVKIGKFVWLSGSNDSSQIYVHSFNRNGNESALLVDNKGRVLAVMSSVELIDTTVKAIESILEQQLSSMPQCWEEAWRKVPSPLEHSTDMEKAKGKYYTPEFHQNFEDQYNIPSDHLIETFEKLEKLVFLNILRALHEIGWEPEIHTCFNESSLVHKLGVVPEFRKYFSFICDVLEAEGILQKINTGRNLNNDFEWNVVQQPPSIQEILDMLNKTALSSYLVERFEPTLLLQVIGENLSSLLKGNKSAISLLFPDGEKKYPSISNFYDQYGELIGAAQLEGVGELVLRHVVNSQTTPDQVFRILEIGAGTGACTEKAISILSGMNSQFEYTYTDISAAFFPAAEKRFDKHLKSIKFQKLNIEEDPISQGFTPDYFDIVVAGEVIHATKDINESLRHISMLMKPWARLNIQETTKVNRIHAFSFGTLDGYWRFEDVKLRQRYCVLEKNIWAQVLEANGFEVDGIFSVFNNDHSYFSSIKAGKVSADKEASHTWLLFHHSEHPLSNYLQENIRQVYGRRVVTVTEGDNYNAETTLTSFVLRKRVYDDFVELLKAFKTRRIEIEGIVYCWALNDNLTAQEDVLQPYFNLTKSLLTLNVAPRLSLITSGVVPLDDGGVLNFHKSTLWGYNKSLKNENFHLKCKSIDVTDGVWNENRMQEIFYEIWNSDKQVQVAFHGNSRHVPKFQRQEVRNDSLKLPSGTDRYQLILPETKSISDLQFGSLSTSNMKQDEVEVQIKASALNFRDLLSIIKPSDEFKNVNTVGFDFAGVIKRVGEKVEKLKVGDRVFGLNVHFTAMPSHVTLPEEFVLPLADNMSFCEGATLPAVYITSMLCLLDIAKVQKEDVVLIHTASGGVGLSAIEICKHIGCNIIVTAGSKRKQRYLSSLGIQHIFNSRNTEYGDQILEVTNGNGVDVVLNSLTSEGFKEATLKACAKGARFIEMSKLNIWDAADVKALRPDVKYKAIDLTHTDRREWIRLLNALVSTVGKQFVKPIPHVRFDALDIILALEYMQKAKHIGKIVCTLPDLRHKDSGELEVFRPLFNEQATYLITGGLGGIGFVVAQWMLEKGAKYIVLAGRSAPSTSTLNKINKMNSCGAKLIPVQLDVGNFKQCKNLIYDEIPKLGLPKLKGVMHAAGILSDGLIVNQDWEKLRATFDTKINGTLNLHELTKDKNLECFVLFSSVVALLGTSGQSNHAAANMFEDAIVNYRNSIGLPATSINWGQWGEVGVAKEIDLAGIKVLSNLQGITGLEYVMNTQRPQTTIVNVESFVLLSKILPQLPVYLDEGIWKASSGNNCVAIKSDDFWQQYDSSTEDEEKIALITNALGIIIRNVLKMEDRELLDNNANLQEMGVDSLMFVEIKNLVQILMGERVVVNVSSLKDCNTIGQLAATLSGLIEGNENNEKPTVEQVNQLLREDCYLPDHIAAKNYQSVIPIRDVTTLLLTGCTGTFGPYVLKQLSNLPQISQVVCVIRPRRNEKEVKRLQNVLSRNSLQVNMSKVRCVKGNVTESHLGMDSEVWNELIDTVDAVFHCAAKVEHAEYYKKRESKTDTRAVNISGTKNVLEFACEKRLKHVFYTSTLVAVTTIDNGRMSERWPEIGDYDGIMAFAYPITKYVGDILMKQAVQRGIPCKVFRLPYVAGESSTGRCSMENNHFLLRYMFIMKNGIMPSSAVPMTVLPVDVIADATIRLSFHEKAEPGVYNINHGFPAADQEFVSVAEKFGYKINFVELSDFAQRVQESNSSALEILKQFYQDGNEIMDIYAGAPILQRWIEGGGRSTELWISEKVSKIIPEFYQNQRPTMEYVYKDLLFCKSKGWFEKFGL